MGGSRPRVDAGKISDAEGGQSGTSCCHDARIRRREGVSEDQERLWSSGQLGGPKECGDQQGLPELSFGCSICERRRCPVEKGGPGAAWKLVRQNSDVARLYPVTVSPVCERPRLGYGSQQLPSALPAGGRVCFEESRRGLPQSLPVERRLASCCCLPPRNDAKCCDRILDDSRIWKPLEHSSLTNVARTYAGSPARRTFVREQRYQRPCQCPGYRSLKPAVRRDATQGFGERELRKTDVDWAHGRGPLETTGERQVHLDDGFPHSPRERREGGLGRAKGAFTRSGRSSIGSCKASRGTHRSSATARNASEPWSILSKAAAA